MSKVKYETENNLTNNLQQILNTGNLNTLDKLTGWKVGMNVKR